MAIRRRNGYNGTCATEVGSVGTPASRDILGQTDDQLMETVAIKIQNQQDVIKRMIKISNNFKDK